MNYNHIGSAAILEIIFLNLFWNFFFVFLFLFCLVFVVYCRKTSFNALYFYTVMQHVRYEV